MRAPRLRKLSPFFALLLTTGIAHAWVSDGVLTKAFVPVVKLTFDDSQKDRSLCTATQVSPRHLLSAAHCLCGSTALEVNDKPLVDAEVFIHPRVDCKTIGGKDVPYSQYRHDLAIVRVRDADVHKLTGARYGVDSARAASGTKVKMVGYGVFAVRLDAKNQFEFGVDDGEKRVGTNVIEDHEHEMHNLQAALPPLQENEKNHVGKDAVTLPGDSGGPLLRAIEINGRTTHLVVGVSSMIEVDERKSAPELRSRFADVSLPENREWIREKLRD